MKPVHSSNVHSIGYDPDTRKMQVKFKSGHSYEYSDVPPETHAAFVGANSVGGHYHKHIRGKFEGRKIEE